MPGATAVPQLLQEPGFLYWAPVLSTEPTNTVAGSVFTDAWPVAWISLGATEEGATFATELSVEATRAAEFFNPLRWSTVDRASSWAFACQDWTLANLKRINNGGAMTTVSGAGATLLSKYEEPDAGSEVRCMIGWESLDHTLRGLARQAINGGTIESGMRKAPDKALLAATFQFEQPAAGKPYSFWAAGVGRTGT